jgi:hypothetical protein
MERYRSIQRLSLLYELEYERRMMHNEHGIDSLVPVGLQGVT